MSEAEREAERRYPLLSRGDDAQAYRQEGFIAGAEWGSAQAVSLPDRETLIESLKVAMLATTDGGFIDSDSEIPAGEMFRLAGEWVKDVLAAPSTQPAAHPQDFAVDVPGGQFLPSAQPAAGEVETQEERVALIEACVRALTPMVTNETHAWNLWNLIAADNGAIRKALEAIWRYTDAFRVPIEDPEPAPELSDLFPGTLAALDRLSIRPEVQP